MGNTLLRSKKVIADYIFWQAESSFRNKYYSSAKSQYANYIDRFPDGENIAEAKEKLKKTKKRYESRKSSGYLGLTYESQKAYGIAAGRLNVNGLGFYYNPRGTKEAVNFRFMEATAEETALVRSFVPLDVIRVEDRIKENSKEARISVSIGLSYPITHPIWFYVGGGVDYHESFLEVIEEEFYFKFEDEKVLNFFPEAGLKIRLGKNLTLIGGVVYVRDELLYKVGIGF